MRPPDQPDLLLPDERFRQVATILAVGVRRLRRRPPTEPDPGDNPRPINLENSLPAGLELRGETVLSVHTG